MSLRRDKGGREPTPPAGRMQPTAACSDLAFFLSSPLRPRPSPPQGAQVLNDVANVVDAQLGCTESIRAQTVKACHEPTMPGVEESGGRPDRALTRPCGSARGGTGCAPETSNPRQGRLLLNIYADLFSGSGSVLNNLANAPDAQFLCVLNPSEHKELNLVSTPGVEE